MKIRTKLILLILMPILLVLQLAYPACWAAAIYTDLYFQEYHPKLFVALTVVLMLIAVGLLWKCKPMESKFYNICCYFLMPLSIVNGAVWLVCLPLYMMILMAVNIACAVTLFYHCTGGWKLLSEIISCLLALNFIWFCGLVLILKMDKFSVKVIEEYHSPNGTYTAQVVLLERDDSRHLEVQLCDHSRDVELLIGKLHLREKRIQCFDKDADPSIRWQDEDTLLINEESYEIDRIS